MTTERHACGIGAFLPMSCRGRAEAFARRLQTRLQHLGAGSTPGADDTASENEESWLTNQARYPTIHQPRLSSSSESDIFFDFDVDLESPGSGSPLEEILHLNKEGEEGRSPGSDTSDGNYYDPLEQLNLSPLAPLAEEGEATPVAEEGEALTPLAKEGEVPTLAKCNGHGDCDSESNRDGATDSDDAAATETESRAGCTPPTTPPTPLTPATPTTTSREKDCGAAAASEGAEGHCECNGSCATGAEGGDAVESFCSTFARSRECVLECGEMGLFLTKQSCVPQGEGDVSRVGEKEGDVSRVGEGERDASRVGEGEGDVSRVGEAERDVCRVGKGEGDVCKVGEGEGIEEGGCRESSEAICNGVPAIEAGCPLVDKSEDSVASKGGGGGSVIVENGESSVHNKAYEIIVIEKIDATCIIDSEKSLIINQEYESSDSEEVENGCNNEEESNVDVIEHETKPNENDGASFNGGETDLKLAIETDNVAEHCTEEREESKEAHHKESSEESASSQVEATNQNAAEECKPERQVHDSSTQDVVVKVDEICQTEEEELQLLIENAAQKKTAPLTSPSTHSEDDDEDEYRPRRVQRCSSLKTGKTPPGTPGRKKIVRFADVLGLDLADVRTFLDEIPKIPTSAYEDLPNADLTLGNSTSTPQRLNHMSCSMPKPDRSMMPLFQQPGGCPDFLDRVRSQYVCLENAMVKDLMTCTVAGTVRVLNLDFYKTVHIRYSLDSWATYADLQATYVANSCDGLSDTFSFTLYANSLQIGQRLEFAVRFQCHGNQYWDSNHGNNYVFQCLPPPGPAPSLSLDRESDRWASFY